MPFKSEKQRRYLWANEPEIARDWADTYGSRIEKNDGGIMRVGLRRGSGGPAGGATIGSGSIQSGSPASQGQRQPGHSVSNTRTHTPTKTHTPSGDGPGNIHGGPTVKDALKRAEQKNVIKRLEEDKREEQVEKFRHKNINSPWNKVKNFLPVIGPISRMAGPFGNRGFFLDKVLKAGHYGGVTEDEFYGVDMSDAQREEIYKEYMRARGSGIIDAYGRKIDPTIGGEGGQGYMGYPSYAAWQAAQQGGGGGGKTTVAEEVVETQSPFQKSLNTGTAQAPSPYYVGANPTAANIAWGQQFGVDPRTMYMAEGGPIRQRYFLGKLVKKIGRAAKKIVKSPIGKIGALAAGAYFAPQFLGAGKAGFGQWGNIPFLKSAMQKPLTSEGWNQKGGWLRRGLEGLFMGGGKDDKYEGKWNPWKVGIGALTLSPFLMGGKEEKEGEKAFDYDAAKNAYVNELMKIKRDAMAGTLDPSQFVYQGIKDGGRIGYAGGGSEDPMLVDEYKKYVFEMEEQGLQPMSFEEFKAQALAGMASGGRAGYYAGGQSIPSKNSMEDARKTAMQDRLGGITEVMKQADLYRQGDVGQMYMAEGGPTQEAGIMNLGGVEKDYRETGGFVPIGKEEKADDVPARLSLNEFVMTADAVRGMGEGDIDKGAERMEDLMDTLEVKGKKNQGAQDMFEVSERLSAVV